MNKTPFYVELDPGSTATTYSAGDVIGTLMELPIRMVTPAGSTPVAEIMSLILKDAEQQVGDISLYLFSETFTAPADGAAYDPNTASLALLKEPLVVRGSISPSDWDSIGTAGIAKLNGVFSFVPVADGKVYGLLVARSTITWAQAGSLTGAIAGQIG